MANHRQTKKPSILFDSPAIACIIVLCTTLVYGAILIFSSRFLAVYSEYFMIGIGIIIGMVLLLHIVFRIGYIRRARSFRRVTIYYGLFILIIGSVGAFYLYRANTSIDKIIDVSNKESIAYSVVSFKKGDSEKTMDNQKIGYAKNSDTDFDSIMKTNVQKHSRTVEYIEYPSTEQMLRASLNDEIQFAVVPERFGGLASSMNLEADPFVDSKVLFGFKTSLDKDISNVDVLTEPFSVLMLGNNEDLSDSIILATFNPKSLQLTMTSIARDSYVPIACYASQSRDKINHARARGRQCIIDTVESFLDVNVDFYFETDFYALVKIVDALGGVDIESPKTFAGSYPLEGTAPIEYEGVTVPEGVNRLNGKQFLTFVRERHAWEASDFQRQLNQQYGIKQVASKVLATRDPNTLINILDSAKNNITTNLPMAKISDLMGYALKSIEVSNLEPMETFRIVQSQVGGEAASTATGMSIVRPYRNDVERARNLIDLNLEKTTKLRNITEFGFEFLDPYVTFDDHPLIQSDNKGFWDRGNFTSGEVEKPAITEPKEPEVETTVPVKPNTSTSNQNVTEKPSAGSGSGSGKPPVDGGDTETTDETQKPETNEEGAGSENDPGSSPENTENESGNQQNQNNQHDRSNP